MEQEPVIERWRRLLTGAVEGRDVILAGAPLAAYTPRVERLRELGARRFLCVGGGVGTGDVPSGPDVESVVLDFGTRDVIDEFRAWERAMSTPDPELRDTIDAFDRSGDALVLVTPFQAVDALGGRRVLGGRRQEWVALEDKTRADALFDRAGIAHPPALVVDATRDDLLAASRQLDAGDGTVWAGDASGGFNGGAQYVRRLRHDATSADVDDALAFLAARCERVRVAPFVEGIPCSIHGFVCADGVAVFRPVELVTLRPAAGNRFQYAGIATFWDPPAGDRDAMRAACRKVGELLRAEVGYRGAYTVDGILSAEGWVATECNPRYGAGLAYAAVAAREASLDLLHHLVVAGETGVLADDLERVVVAAADERRMGAVWTVVDTAWDATHVRPVVHDGGAYRAALDGERPDAHVVCGPAVTGGGVRIAFEAERVPVGPSVAPLAVAGYAFADAAFGAGLGPLSAARAVR
jgi:hypothetical protein